MGLMLAAGVAFAGALTVRADENPKGRADLIVNANPQDTEGAWRLAGRMSGCAGLAASFSADGSRILTAGKDGARVWGTRDLKPLTEPLKHGQPIDAAALNANGTRIVTAAGLNEVRLWNARTGELTRTLKTFGTVLTVALSPDNSRLAISLENGVVQIWDANADKPLLELRHPAAVKFVTFSPDGGKVLTITVPNREDASNGAIRGAARLWEVRKGVELKKIVVDDVANGRRERWLRPAAFSRDGKRVATIDFRNVVIWGARGDDGDAPPIAVDTSDHGGFAVSVGFNPDGHKLVTADTGSASLWDLTNNGRWLGELKSRGVVDAQFSPDGSQVLTAGTGPATGVWEVASGKQVLSVAGKDRNGVPVVAWSPDDKRIAVSYAKEDETVVWEQDVEHH